jgi:TPR repeat protein
MKKALKLRALAPLIGILVGCLPSLGVAGEAAKPPAKTDASTNARVDRLHKALYERSQSGDAEAMTNLASIMEQGDEITPIDRGLAYDLYEPAAKLGNAIAIKKMCLAYLLGEGRPKDVVKASGFCNKVDGKDAVTFFWGGYDYQFGVTGPADMEAAKASYQEAFLGGSGEAADAIGQMAFEGGHLEAARSWYRKGASLGSADAMAHLAGMVALGQGGVKDGVEANWLYGISAQRGNISAAAWREAHPGPDVPTISLGSGDSQITLTHTYGQGADQKTEPLTIGRISTLMHTRLYGMIANGADHYYYYAFFDCYAGVSREIDLCIATRDYPLNLGTGRILHAIWDGRITLPERDAAGNATAQSRVKSGVFLVSAD